MCWVNSRLDTELSRLELCVCFLSPRFLQSHREGCHTAAYYIHSFFSVVWMHSCCKFCTFQYVSSTSLFLRLSSQQLGLECFCHDTHTKREEDDDKNGKCTKCFRILIFGLARACISFDFYITYFWESQQVRYIFLYGYNIGRRAIKLEQRGLNLGFFPSMTTKAMITGFTLSSLRSAKCVGRCSILQEQGNKQMLFSVCVSSVLSVFLAPR